MRSGRMGSLLMFVIPWFHCFTYTHACMPGVCMMFNINNYCMNPVFVVSIFCDSDLLSIKARRV